MKRGSKSAAKRINPFLFLGLFLLGGCADTPWPTWITGEPGQDILNAPRAVERPAKPAALSWPNLGDVPQEKPKFSEPLALKDEAELLKSEQLKAQAAKERIQDIPLPKPTESAPTVAPESPSEEPPSFALRPE